MGLSETDRRTLVGLELEKANRFLRQADRQREEKEWDLAANRYYYACFHAVQALFTQNAIEVHKHAGLLRQFGQKFILTGIINRPFGPFLNKMEQLRTKADYNVLVTISEEEIMAMYQPAHELVELIARMTDTPLA